MAALVALAAARPQQGFEQPEVRVLNEAFDQDESGSYQYQYELDNGQKVRLENSRAVPRQKDASRKTVRLTTLWFKPDNGPHRNPSYVFPP